MPNDLPTRTALPECLTDRDQWLCWRREDRNGTKTKVPINPHTGSFGSATDDDSWADFETAREYAIDGPVDGLGFVFTAEDPLVGVDLDDCRVPETGTLTDDAADVVDRLASYTEVSPSGTGVHVLVKGTLPGDRNRQGWVELYETARYFTVTGEHVDATPATVESRTSELAAVHATYVGEAEPADPEDPETATDPETSANQPDEPTGDTADETATDPDADRMSEGATNGLDDDAVIERAHAAANGEKFARLWEGATTGYESHSEADMALCALLAFWTGGDRKQIDRLFRRSGLLREKWDDRHFADGSTYGERTIDRVLAGTDEFYQPAPEPAADEEPTTRTSATRDVEELRTTVHSLRREVEELAAREEQYLSIIADLQAQVERLEAESNRGRDDRSSASAGQPASVAREDEAGSLRRRLASWVTPSDGE